MLWDVLRGVRSRDHPCFQLHHDKLQTELLEAPQAMNPKCRRAKTRVQNKPQGVITDSQKHRIKLGKTFETIESNL